MNLQHDEMYHRLNDLYDQDYQNNWKRHFAASISFHAPSLPGYEHIKDLELNENVFVYVSLVKPGKNYYLIQHKQDQFSVFKTIVPFRQHDLPLLNKNMKTQFVERKF